MGFFASCIMIYSDGSVSEVDLLIHCYLYFSLVERLLCTSGLKQKTSVPLFLGTMKDSYVKLFLN